MKTGLLLAGVFAVIAALFVVSSLATSETEAPQAPAPAAAPVEPAVITIEVTPSATPFAVGDSVTVDGLVLPDGTIPVGKVVEILGVRLWINISTGEGTEMQSYMLEFTVDGQTEQVLVPEIAIKKAQ